MVIILVHITITADDVNYSIIYSVKIINDKVEIILMINRRWKT